MAYATDYHRAIGRKYVSDVWRVLSTRTRLTALAPAEIMSKINAPERDMPAIMASVRILIDDGLVLHEQRDEDGFSWPAFYRAGASAIEPPPDEQPIKSEISLVEPSDYVDWGM